MKTATISSLTLFEASRAAITRNQARLAEIEVELSTGRHADVGRTLGVDASRDLEMRNTFDDLSSLLSTNGVVSTRLNQTQTALSAIRDLADGFLQTVLAASQGGADRSLLVTDAVEDLADPCNNLPKAMRAQIISIGIWILRELEDIRTGKAEGFADVKAVSQPIRDGLL